MHTLSPIRSAICASCASVFVLSAGAQMLHFDKKWWQRVNDDEKQSFVAGYLDSPCSPGISAPGDEIQKFLDGFFEKHSGVTVPSALQVARHQMKPSTPLSGGEVWKEAHGYMDGAWWGDTTHGEHAEQQGYVEGYLACKHQPVTSEDIRSYVVAMNKYYDAPKHEHTKIAYVIEPLIAKKEIH